jgi:mRNA-degrading endonuclease toxin of MazEF toxin-antitoxin module
MSSGSSLSRIALLLLGAAALPWARPAAAQGRPPLVTVVVTTSDTHEPLAGAAVEVLGMNTSASTNVEGVAQLEHVRTGARTVEVRHAGYLPSHTALVVPSNATELLQVEMIPAPVKIEGVDVQGTRQSPLLHNGFFVRKQSGQGTFVTREEIEKAHPGALSDVLRRMEGVALTPNGLAAREFGQTRARMRGNIGGECQPQVFIDGALTSITNLDEILPQSIEGIELYRGAATVPAEYNRGSSMCGVVLIWTKVN